MKERLYAEPLKTARRWTFSDMEYNGSNSRLVYSTAYGSICPKCAKAFKRCSCLVAENSDRAETAATACLRYVQQARAGRGATFISGLALSQNELLALAKKLKQRFGTGATVEGFVIQLQGNFLRPATEALRKLGFNVK
jgi:translation initiation factor 1